MNNLEELNKEEILNINGGGERYAYFFGSVLRYAIATAVAGPIGASALAIYDYHN